VKQAWKEYWLQKDGGKYVYSAREVAKRNGLNYFRMYNKFAQYGWTQRRKDVRPSTESASTLLMAGCPGWGGRFCIECMYPPPCTDWHCRACSERTKCFCLRKRKTREWRAAFEEWCAVRERNTRALEFFRYAWGSVEWERRTDAP
jgi:hypothetical protein